MTKACGIEVSAMVIAIVRSAIGTKVADAIGTKDAIAIGATEFIPIGIVEIASGTTTGTMDGVVPAFALKTKMVTFTAGTTSELGPKATPPG
jgi:hypothetical protein